MGFPEKNPNWRLKYQNFIEHLINLIDLQDYEQKEIGLIKKILRFSRFESF